MNKIYLLLSVFISSILFFIDCKPVSQSDKEFSEVHSLPKLQMTEAELYDKILGNLVGSAYGDAMGAPTEMWSRADIQFQYGTVTDLDSMIREASPEGPWKHNQPAGGTTDDTRWKQLTYEYLLTQDSELNPLDFANSILKKYNAAIDNFKKISGNAPEPFEENMLKMGWLQEWAKVAEPYVKNDADGYAKALNKFYGGEMVCAGLLYAPAVGAFYAGNPAKAYTEMYRISLFDIGYARDISSLSAAITAMANTKNATKKDLLRVARETDPEKYFQSRLVGRTAFRILKEALWISSESKKQTDTTQQAYKMLDNHLQDMPFHAGEIYLQVLTAMIFSDFDFQKTMQFLVNYGRDNDTTAAVAGGILGSFHGFKKLPSDKTKVIEQCKKNLDIDLEYLAKNLTQKIIDNQ